MKYVLPIDDFVLLACAKQMWMDMDRIAKRKRLCSYNKELKAKKTLIKSVSSNSTIAYCTLCVGSFHRGAHDPGQHAATEI